MKVKDGYLDGVLGKDTIALSTRERWKAQNFEMLFFFSITNVDLISAEGIMGLAPTKPGDPQVNVI